MRKRIFAFVVFMVITITSSFPVLAYDSFNVSDNFEKEITIPVPIGMSEHEIQNMLSKSIYIESSSDVPYEIVFVDDEELQILISEYNNQAQKNILPNFLAITLIKNSSYSVTLKITNIAIDFLDVVYGYIFLYDEYGYNGSTSFRFTKMPPMFSEYATCVALYGAFNSGMFFLEAIDGSAANSGTWFF